MEAGPNVAGIGTFPDGSVLGYDMRVGGSFLFTGTAGAGKSVALHTLVGGVLARGGHVLVGKLRIRRGDYEQYLEDSNFELAQGVSALVAALRTLTDETASRPRTLVVIDDTPTLVDISKPDALAYDKKKLAVLIRRVVKSPDVDVAIAGQRLDPKLLGQGWREHMAPVQFGRLPQAASHLIFGEATDTSGVRLGEALAHHADGTVQIADIWMREEP